MIREGEIRIESYTTGSIDFEDMLISGPAEEDIVDDIMYIYD
jgi:hypothetical protein